MRLDSVGGGFHHLEERTADVRVYLKPATGNGSFAPVPGPADLTGKSGTLRVVGLPAVADSTAWTLAIGAFVCRGGSVERS